ncbi:MAG TPA: helix-turn-helix domain-containing protein [Tepidiformaceae bacterium]|nr:helix-turn-helix domain-containing protein [Tepidiformaceae bacterium]
MSGSEPGRGEPNSLPRDDHFLAELQRELGRLTREMRSPEATLDLLFLAYLLKTSRFGYFSFGPVTIDVRLIEDLVTRTTIHSSDLEAGAKAGYSDDCIRFLRVLTDEVERSGRRRIDEVHFLLAFMQVGEGIPGRVFAELGVSADEVRSFVPEREATAGRLYSPEEAAEYLGVHVKTVRNWIRAGRLPAGRLAGQRVLRIKSSDLNRLLEPVSPEDLDRGAVDPDE